jgi:hypothetical protein
MGRRRIKPEQIIHMLRETEIKLASGKSTGEVCRDLGRENAQLKKLVAEQAPELSCLGAIPIHRTSHTHSAR